MQQIFSRLVQISCPPELWFNPREYRHRLRHPRNGIKITGLFSLSIVDAR